MADLVACSGLSRRAVRDVIRRLGDEVEVSDQCFRLKSGAVDRVLAEVQCDELARLEIDDPWARRARSRASDLETINEAKSALPPPVQDLDHVTATTETVVKRALYLSTSFDLVDRHVLFVGDHDLTAPALALIEPRAMIHVVDIDESILEVIARFHRDHASADIRTYWADLRLGLPRSLRKVAALAFMDPPYTPDGVELFLTRGIEGLERHDFGRIVFCHGFGEKQVGLGYQAQEVASKLRLATEAILPKFNSYVGAEALGSASNLHVCRPTRRTWPTADKHTARAAAQIYTHGESAVESSRTELPHKIVGVSRGWATADGRSPAKVVGDGWPDGAGSPKPVPLSRYWRDLTEPTTGRSYAPGDAVLVNLWPHYGASLERIVLLSADRPTCVVASRKDLDRLLDSANGAAWLARRVVATRPLTETDSEISVIALEPKEGRDQSESVLLELLRRSPSKLVNAWRDALISAARSAGRTLTKNDARAAISASGLADWVLHAFVWELHGEILRELPAAVARSVVRLRVLESEPLSAG